MKDRLVRSGNPFTPVTVTPVLLNCIRELSIVPMP